MPLTIEQLKITLADYVLGLREKELENATLRETVQKLIEDNKTAVDALKKLTDAQDGSSKLASDRTTLNLPV